jgi:pimeloyl-ACP methyl ester carboxylesterase
VHKQVITSIGSLHVVEASQTAKRAVLFLHGWPENWSTWEKVLEQTKNQVHCIAMDLPGIGGSVMPNAPTSKSEIANAINELADAMGLDRFVLVGHDAGGMVVFSYLARFAKRLDAAVIMNVVIPGVKPWEKVIVNPYIWHFKFHAEPNLPETLVSGKERAYFDHFYDAITANPKSIGKQAREEYVKAYLAPSALSTGFGWYRSFEQDAKENKTFVDSKTKIDTPLLYLRGDHEGGNINEYVEGFTEAGLTSIQSAIVRDSGHFAPEEQPEQVWRIIKEFIDKKAT